MQNSFQNIALLIRTKRRAKNISQSDLSTALGYKNGQFVSNVERALCSIPLKIAPKLCEILSISNDEIKAALVNDYIGDIDRSLMPAVQSTDAQ